MAAFPFFPASPLISISQDFHRVERWEPRNLAESADSAWFELKKASASAIERRSRGRRGLASATPSQRRRTSSVVEPGRKNRRNETERGREREGEGERGGGSRRRKEEEEQEPRRYERKHGAVGERGIERGVENEERERERRWLEANRQRERELRVRKQDERGGGTKPRGGAEKYEANEGKKEERQGHEWKGRRRAYQLRQKRRVGWGEGKGSRPRSEREKRAKGKGWEGCAREAKGESWESERGRERKREGGGASEIVRGINGRNPAGRYTLSDTT